MWGAYSKKGEFIIFKALEDYLNALQEGYFKTAHEAKEASINEVDGEGKEIKIPSIRRKRQ